MGKGVRAMLFKPFTRKLRKIGPKISKQKWPNIEEMCASRAYKATHLKSYMAIQAVTQSWIWVCEWLL